MASYSSTTRTVVPAVPGYCGTTVAELEYSRNSNTMYFFAESFLPKHKCSTTVSVQYEYETDNHVCLLHWHWHQYWHAHRNWQLGNQLATGQPPTVLLYCTEALYSIHFSITSASTTVVLVFVLIVRLLPSP